jgi:hypothetical protein
MLYWRLGETSGTTAADSSLNVSPGRYTGNHALGIQSWLSADDDAAVEFITDGNPGTSNGRVTSSYNPFLAGTVRTFGGWGWLNNLKNHHAFFGGDGTQCGALRQVAHSRSIEFDGFAGSPTWTNAIPSAAGGNVPGTHHWFHWVVIFDDPNDTLELFIDGASQGRLTGITDTWSGTGNLMLGARNDTVSDPWSGYMDEFAVWERALTPEEIAAQYLMARNRRWPSTYQGTRKTGTYYHAVMALEPSLYWRLDEPDGAVSVEDLSGNGRSGRYVGASKIEFNESGATDTRLSVRFAHDHLTKASVLAYDYEPFVPGAQLSVTGLSKARPTGNTFRNLFAGTGTEADQDTHPVLEYLAFGTGPGTSARGLRFYGDVTNDVTRRSNDWPDAWPGINTWVHWVFTWDDVNRDAVLYIDGVARRRTTNNLLHENAGGFSGNGGKFQVGQRGIWRYDEVWEGWMDEIAVFERVLPPSEVHALFAATNHFQSPDEGA